VDVDVAPTDCVFVGAEVVRVEERRKMIDRCFAEMGRIHDSEEKKKKEKKERKRKGQQQQQAGKQVVREKRSKKKRMS
jgi:hypothetical protein